MSKILGTLAAVILAISALVAFKNKEAKAIEIDNCNTSLKVEKATKKELTELLASVQSLKDNERDLLAATEEEQAKFEKLVADNDRVKKEIERLKADHSVKAQELAHAEDVLKSLPNPDELLPKIKRMRSELAESTDSLASEEARLANLTQRDKNARVRIGVMRNELSLRSSGKSFPSLKTRISSIYRNWGFVVISAGDRDGVVTGSTLDVVRDGEVIAKLKVTAVEPGRASADIILDSMAAGESIQIGDSVVAETQAETKTALN